VSVPFGLEKDVSGFFRPGYFWTCWRKKRNLTFIANIHTQQQQQPKNKKKNIHADSGKGWTPQISADVLKNFQASQAKIQAEQKAVGYVHLIGTKIAGVHLTSQVIPLAGVLAGTVMLVKGYYNLYNGTGRLD